MEYTTVTQTVRTSAVPNDVRNALYRITSSQANLLTTISTNSNIDFLKKKLKGDLEHLRTDVETLSIFSQTSPQLLQTIPELSAEFAKSGRACEKILDAVQTKKHMFREYLGSETLKKICLDIRKLMPNVNIGGGVNISLDGKVNINNNAVTERAQTGVNQLSINPMETTHTVTGSDQPFMQGPAYSAPPGVMPTMNPYPPQMMMGQGVANQQMMMQGRGSQMMYNNMQAGGPQMMQGNMQGMQAHHQYPGAPM